MKLKFTIFVLLLGWMAHDGKAQSSPVPCKTTLLGSSNMKILYGGKTTVFQAYTVCKNIGLFQSSQITPADFDLALNTIALVPGNIANVALTNTFNKQPTERVKNELTLGLGTLGVLEAAKVLSLSAGPFGLAVTGVITVIQYILPYFTKNEVPLDFSNQCSNLQPVILAPGAMLGCNLYIQKPARSAPQLPMTLTFQLGGSFPAPMPLPNPSPVELKRPEHAADLTILQKIMKMHEEAAAYYEQLASTKGSNEYGLRP